MISRFGNRLRGTALVALLAFLAAFAQSALVHTDDGCAVEMHCLACRLALGTTAVAPAPALPLGADLIDLGAAPPAPAQPVVEIAREAVASRGPPLA